MWKEAGVEKPHMQQLDKMTPFELKHSKNIFWTDREIDAELVTTCDGDNLKL